MLSGLRRIVEFVWPPALASRRALNVLRGCLSPEQLEQYDKERRFVVRGGETGRRYLIRRGWSMNIDELDVDGAVVRTWCFYPEGRLSKGDVMLAQKVRARNV
jgi:hypothetical protein